MKNNSSPAPRFCENDEFGEPEKEHHMAVGLSVVGGLLLAGFAFSRLRARKGTRKGVLKLFS
jgi:hypothetical protein